MSNALERWFDGKRLNPFREYSKAEETFDRLANEMISLKRENGQALTFTPACEIFEDADRFILRFDMPGVTRDQIKVEVNKSQLTVHAERTEEKKQKDKRKYLSEIFYGAYSRSFALPGPVDDEDVDARFENGVLTVSIPRTVAPVPGAKQIAVH